MLSRVAENIYWMARHLERAENTARLVAVHSETRLDRADRGGFYWEPVLRITGVLEEYRRRGFGASERDATNFLVNDDGNHSSVLASCTGARENVRILRETLPRETWEAVQALYQTALRPGAAAPQRRDEHLREVIARVQGMAGLFLRAMNDDEGYAFLRLGRAVERGDFAARILMSSIETFSEGPSEEVALRLADWVGVLKSLTAYQMYRRSVRGPVAGPRVVHFLACSTVFPGAVAYCVREIEQALVRLPGSGPAADATARLTAALGADGAVTRDERKFAVILTAAQTQLAELHDAIGATYFALPPQPAPPMAQTQVQSA
jgi:uncharacterized alpha-E superfamily protein